MRVHHILPVLFVTLVNALYAVPFVGATEENGQVPTNQVVTISDTRTGSGPCGFAIQRDLEGTIVITPRVDDTGQLVLTIGKVDVSGRLTNTENGKSVDIHWVQQNHGIGFAANGASIDVMLGIDGVLFRGYDTADSRLRLDLPSDEAELAEFTPGHRNQDSWAHVCGLLS